MLFPLAMAQFIASYDSSSMNVAISNIVQDLHTTVTGVQTAITIFTLTMAALMIPGSKLSDIAGRKICFVVGIMIYGTGALITSLSPSLGFMLLGWSLLEGIGSALMIPPIYIITTVSFPDIKSRARAFALISAMAGMGSASGPLIGGIITSTITWKASFASEVIICIIILSLSSRIIESRREGPKSKLDIFGTILSAAGLVSIVLGLLQAGNYGWLRSRKNFYIGNTLILEQGSISPVILFAGAGVIFLIWFYFHIRSMERRKKEPLLSTKLFHNRAADLGLVTQNVQWLIMIGTFFIISVYLQVSREISAIETGIVLTPATAGLLIASSRAGTLARKHPQRSIIISGFVVTITGIILNLLLVRVDRSLLYFVPGLFLIGAGVGLMLTASVNVVQSSVPERDQGEISGLSRSVSNLGSSLGTAVAGAVLISSLISGISTLTDDNTVLNTSQKEQIKAAASKDITALSDTQVESALKGQPLDVVEAVVQINAEARNRALARAQVSIALIGFIGLLAAVMLPRR